MAPVARELSAVRGVIEPLQTVSGVGAQVQELAALIDHHGQVPVELIGWSWGAWLGFLLASQFPHLVAKLIIVGAPPFEEGFAKQITATRLERLSPEQRSEAISLMRLLEDPAATSDTMHRLHDILLLSDSCDLLPHPEEVLDFQPRTYRETWPEAAELRSSGRLLAMVKHVRCPVVALHGDSDPHPAEGVNQPLSRVLADFRFILLPRCGHYPWFESAARGEFFSVLDRELHFPG